MARTKPPTARTANISQTGVLARKKPGARVKIPTVAAVQTSTLRKPNSFIIGVAAGREIRAPMAMATVSDPACSGLQPMPICSSKGIRNGVAPMPMRSRVPAVQLARKVLARNSDRSSTGRSALRAWRMNMTMAATPTISAATWTVQGIRLKPRVSARPMVADMATAASTKPTVSKGPGCGSRRRGTNFQTAIMPRMPTGRLM